MSKITQQKMFAFMIQWQESGLSKKAWCEQHKFRYSSFHYWYKRFLGQSSKGEVKHNGFVQVVVKDHPVGKVWCELLLEDGKRVIFHQPISVNDIRSLLY